MITLRFQLELASDAEPGTGRSGALVDDYVTRDAEGRPVLRGSHLKGLMRDRLAQVAGSVAEMRDVADELEDACFGRPGLEGDDGSPARVRISDARWADAPADDPTLEIVRTAVGDLGTVTGGSLRCTEAIAAGTIFRGTLSVDAEEGSLEDLAGRLALLAVDAVGGGRTRGAGACWVTLAHEPRTPGALLRTLATQVSGGARPESAGIPTAAGASDGALGTTVTWLRLIFESHDPVCCPETPVLGTNLIRSGLAVPASAVQGALLTRIDREDSALASACFAHPDFRAWPLLPAQSLADSGAPGWPVRVALSHRLSKLADHEGRHQFRDAAIEPYDWREVAAGSPLKSSDGVLVRSATGSQVRLWRAADMPRVVSTHGVHRGPSGDRNLFSVESMGPATWVGIVALPSEAADVLVASLARNPRMGFGKARSVRGQGALRAEPVDFGDLGGAQTPSAGAGRVFVVQSPVAIPDDWRLERADLALGRLIEEAGWGTVAAEAPSGELRTWATAGVRFGWNRLGKGEMADPAHRRLRARRCFLPGSVVVLDRPLADLQASLLAGVGGGRTAGYGSLLPHPGIAGELYRPLADLEPLESRDRSGQLGYELWELAGRRGPSPSQIGAVLGRLRGPNRDSAIEYLERQSARPEAAWRPWKKIAKRLSDVVSERDPKEVEAAMRTWQDLTIAHRAEDRS